MKKIYLFVSVVFILAVNSSSVFAGSFTDVSSDDFYYDSVELLYDYDIVDGYADGSFGYGSTINRAELLKIVVLAAGVSSDVLSSYAGDSCFSDVKAGAWYTKYICYAKAQEWITGYAGNVFKPGNEINFVEAMRIVGEVLDLPYEEGTTPWYKGVVESAAEYGIIPLTITSFGQIITRAEMADMVARKLKMNDGILNEWLGDKWYYTVTYETIEQGENMFLEYDEQNVGCGEPDCVEDEGEAEVDGSDTAGAGKIEIISHSTGVDTNGKGYYIKLKVKDIGLESGEQYYAECGDGQTYSDLNPGTHSTSTDITIYSLDPSTEYECFATATGSKMSDYVNETTLGESQGLQTYTNEHTGVSFKYPIGADVEISDDYAGEVFTLDVPSYFGDGKMIFTGHEIDSFYGYDSYSPLGSEMVGWVEIGGENFMEYYSDSVKDMGGWLDVPYYNYIYSFTGEFYRWVEIEKYSENWEVGSYISRIINSLTFGTPEASVEITSSSSGLDDLGIPYIDLSATGVTLESGQHLHYECIEAADGVWWGLHPQYDSYGSAKMSMLKSGNSYYCRAQVHNSDHGSESSPSESVLVTTPFNPDQLEVVSSSVSDDSITINFSGLYQGYYYADCSPGYPSGVESSSAYDPPGQTAETNIFTFSGLTGDGTVYKCYGDVEGKDASPYVYGEIW